MPLLNWLEFTKTNLTVRYRANQEPQRLTIDIKLQGRPNIPPAPTAILALARYINRGMAGSDIFAPGAGAAKHLVRVDPTKAWGPDYHCEIEVASVAPIYLRTIVEELRGAGDQQPIASLSIVGDLGLDDTHLSVDEARCRGWLDDVAAYPRPWPKLSFSFDEKSLGGQGITVRITFAKLLTIEARAELQERILGWNNMVGNYVTPDGKFERFKLGQTMPKYAATKRELTFRIELFERTRGPSRDLLLNMMQRFHEEILPVEHIELKL